MSREKAITQSQPNTIEVSSAGESQEQRGLQQSPQSPQTPQTWMYRPDADVLQNDEAYTVVLDMPGVAPENVDLTIEQNTLHIHGRIDGGEHRVPGRFIRQEYGIGSYVRQFALDESIDVDGITAECRDGVLRIHLPRHEATRPRRIPIAGTSE